MRFIISFLAISVLAFSCKKNQKEAEKQEEAIKAYISDNGLNATPTGSGLYYVIESQGTGQSCNSNSNVKVAYKGYFLDGEVFDESPAAGITFNLQGVIKGWTEGIPYFKKGGKGKLLIPSALGYGENDHNGIPGNSILIFDIELIDVL